MCALDDLVPDRGAAALVDGQQVAAVPAHGSDDVHAVDHRDPFSGANVMARGLVGQPRRARRRRLADAQAGRSTCAPGSAWTTRDVALPVWPARVVDGWVEIGAAHRDARSARCSPAPASWSRRSAARATCRWRSDGAGPRSTVAAALGVESHIDEDTLLRADPPDDRDRRRRRRRDDGHRLPRLAGHRRGRRHRARAGRGAARRCGSWPAGPRRAARCRRQG